MFTIGFENMCTVMLDQCEIFQNYLLYSIGFAIWPFILCLIAFTVPPRVLLLAVIAIIWYTGILLGILQCNLFPFVAYPSIFGI